MVCKQNGAKHLFEMKEPEPEPESPFLDEAAYDLPIRDEAWVSHEAELEPQLETPFASALAPAEQEYAGLAAEERIESEMESEELEDPNREAEEEGFHEKEYEYRRNSEGECHVPHAFEEESAAKGVPVIENLHSEHHYPISNKFDESEVSDTLTSDAFVADNNGKGYFVAFPKLGDLTVKKATLLTPSNFENLMDLMLASNNNNFVIDAHGNPKGLYMPLARATKISATSVSLFILRGIDQVKYLVRTAKEDAIIRRRASQQDMDTWRRILEILHSKTWQQMIGTEWPRTIPQVTSADTAERIVQSRTRSLVDSLFHGEVTNKQDRVDRLIKKMQRLQAKGIREIQFRSCNIGKDSDTLREFRKFFGADHLCAPDVRSGMGSTNPIINRQGVDQLARHPRTQVFNLPSGRFAIRIIISGQRFSADCAADTQATVGEWVASHIMANSTYRRGKLPIHFLQTEPLAFPLDRDYVAHIQCRSSFWESVVRGSEEQRQETGAHNQYISNSSEGKFEEQREGEEHAGFIPEGASLRADETELESPEDLEELYSHGHELDQVEELAELKETEGLESEEEELDWQMQDSGEEESVEVELQTPKRRAKSLHSVPTTDIFMHVYFKKLSTSYTREQFFDWIVDQSPGDIGPNRFQLAGVEINLVGNPRTAIADLKGSLKVAGSVVVYFGHTVLGRKTTLGLSPYEPAVMKRGITCMQLTSLLNAAKAKIVVLAGCATSQCVTKIKGDTVVIVTESGADRLTNTLQWAPAIKALLNELLARGTVGDALAAANKSFAKASSTDRFKMINGDPTLKMI